MPRSYFPHAFRPVLPGLLRFQLLLAAAGLPGCFGGGEDADPYTLPKGEILANPSLEVEPDGSVLLLAQSRMLYAHNNPVEEWDRGIRSRNRHSILYRRSNGSWNATPFKNLQREDNSFPALLPVPGAGYQALVWDAQVLKRYAFKDGAWSRRQTLTLPYETQHPGMMASGNWRRHPSLAWTSDTTWLQADYIYRPNEGSYETRLLEMPSGRAVRVDTGSLSLLSLHGDGALRSVFGYVTRMLRNKSHPDSVEYRTMWSYWRWRAGDTAATRHVLDLDMATGYFQSFFSTFRGRTALFLANQTEFRIYPLDASGAPGEPEIIDIPNDGRVLLSLFAPDTAGCIHGLDYVDNMSKRRPTFIHWNTCRPGLDTLGLDGLAPSKALSVDARLRVDFSGNPIVALAVQETLDQPDRTIYGESYLPSWLLFARLEQGAWTTEIVDSR